MPQPKLYDSAAARQAAYRSRCEQERQNELTAKGLPPMPAISSMPGWSRWNAALLMAQEMLSLTLEEMHGYYDDRSESWQNSERGEEHQEKVSSVEAVLDALVDLTL